MRKVTFGGAASLDNYFARDDGSVDWLMWSPEAMEAMNDYWPRVDCIVMGRKTYEAALKAMPPGETENPYGEMKTYVVTRTLGPTEGVEIISSEPADFIRRLKADDGKEICIMGGGELGHALLEGGVIDEIGFNIHPILLGSGIPVFHEMQRDIRLELIECRQLPNGCVYVLYRVKS